MKKFICVLCIILILCGCSNITENWNKVSITQFGDIKFPNEWIVSETNNSLVFADKDINDNYSKVYAIGMVFNDNDCDSCVFEEDSIGTIYVNDIESSKDVKLYSNSAIYSKDYCFVNGDLKWLSTISLSNVNDKGKFIDYIIIFLDESVEEDLIKTIAKTYSHYE